MGDEVIVSREMDIYCEAGGPSLGERFFIISSPGFYFILCNYWNHISYRLSKVLYRSNVNLSRNIHVLITKNQMSVSKNCLSFIFLEWLGIRFDVRSRDLDLDPFNYENYQPNNVYVSVRCRHTYDIPP